MSYTESFSRSIAVHYSGTVTVNYPASEHGGSTTASYSGTAYEQVDVDIHVDTAPFDASVANCNNHVNGLTASVGAMNTANASLSGRMQTKFPRLSSTDFSTR